MYDTVIVFYSDMRIALWTLYYLVKLCSLSGRGSRILGYIFSNKWNRTWINMVKNYEK